MCPSRLHEPRRIKGLTCVSKLHKDLDFVFTQDPESRSVINCHLNSRSPFYKEPWVFKFWFYFWFVFHYFLNLLMFQRPWGKWESPERVSGFEFWNSTIQKFILMFTKTMARGHFGQWSVLYKGWSLSPVRVCQSSPFTPSLLPLFSFFFPLYQHVVACDTS